MLKEVKVNLSKEGSEGRLFRKLSLRQFSALPENIAGLPKDAAKCSQNCAEDDAQCSMKHTPSISVGKALFTDEAHDRTSRSLNQKLVNSLVDHSQPCIQPRFFKITRLCHILPHILGKRAEEIQLPKVSIDFSGRRMTALVDSGAESNIMKSSVAVALNLIPTACDRSLGLGSNLYKFKSLGGVTARANIASTYHTLDFQLLDDLDEDLILGIPFMKLHKRVTLLFDGVDDPLTITPYQQIAMVCLGCGNMQGVMVDGNLKSRCRNCLNHQHLRRAEECLHALREKGAYCNSLHKLQFNSFEMIVPIDFRDCRFAALIDSGATRNLMKLSVAKNLNLSLKGPESKIVYASAKCFEKVLGLVTTKITFNSRNYTLKFAVVDELHDDIILGVDFMRLHREVRFELGGEQKPLKVHCKKEPAITEPHRVLQFLRLLIPPQHKVLMTLLSPLAAVFIDLSDAINDR